MNPTYISNKPSSTLRRGTIATMHISLDGKPACGKELKTTSRLSGALFQYSLCPACRKLQNGR